MRLTIYAIAAAALLAGLSGLYAYAYSRGGAHVQAQWDADHAAQLKALAEARAKAAEVTTRVVTKYVDRVHTVRGKTRTIIKQVPVYVTQESDDRCIVPRGFVRVHDSAAKGTELPATTGSAAQTPSGVALSAVAGTVAGNYGICHETAERLRSLQQWAVEQARVGQ